MACLTNTNDTPQPEDIEFQQVLSQIGGKEKIFLVSDAFKSDQLDETSQILQELIQDMFHIGRSENLDQSPAKNNGRACFSANGQEDTTSEKNSTRETVINCVTLPQAQGNEILVSTRPQDLRLSAKPVGEDSGPPRLNGKVTTTKTSTMNSCGRSRIIDSPMIIFVFRHEFFSGSANAFCLKEILKDVRARTKRASVRPALVGLVRSKGESNETRESVGLLERLLRSVFGEHPPEAIWVGHFIPKSEDRMRAIKKYACKAINSPKSSDNSGNRGRNGFFWHFQCLFWPRRRNSGQANNTLANRIKGDAGSTEEGVPLKAGVMSAGDQTEPGHYVTNSNDLQRS